MNRQARPGANYASGTLLGEVLVARIMKTGVVGKSSVAGQTCPAVRYCCHETTNKAYQSSCGTPLKPRAKSLDDL